MKEQFRNDEEDMPTIQRGDGEQIGISECNREYGQIAEDSQTRIGRDCLGLFCVSSFHLVKYRI